MSFCTTSYAAHASLWVDISQLENAKPPFTVYWSDGVVSKGGKTAYSIVRDAYTPGSAEFSIVRVEGKYCDVDVQIHWSLSNGEILSGQGTPEITILQTKLPAAKITVETTLPDPSCRTFPYTIETIALRPPEIFDFSVTPSTIPVGGTAQIHFKINDQVEWLVVEGSPASRDADFDMGDMVCTDIYGRDCTMTYRDTHGPGHAVLLLHAGNKCTTEARIIDLWIQ